MSPQSVMLDHEREHPEEVYVRKQFHLLMYRLQQMPLEPRARLQGRFTQELLDQTLTVETPRGSLSFVMLGKTGAGRALSLLTKQPATIEWMNSFSPGSVFWDVGANVGVYALYAALRGDVKVVAFEPAAVNYFMLTANCEANKFEDRMDCLLVGLGNERTLQRLEVSQFDSAQSFSFRGKPKRPRRGRQAAFVVPIDQLIQEYGLACPNYIKIDVPGLTESIIAGAVQTLRQADLRELHIEMREGSRGGRTIVEALKQTGFVAAGRHQHSGSTDVTFVRQGG